MRRWASRSSSCPVTRTSKRPTGSARASCQCCARVARSPPTPPRDAPPPPTPPPPAAPAPASARPAAGGALSFVTVVGNPKPASRTLAVATAAAGAITRAAGIAGSPQTIDVCVLARHLLLPEPSPAVEEALDQVTEADLLLVASPTYQGTYTGLLKVFLDRLPDRALGRAGALPP